MKMTKEEEEQLKFSQELDKICVEEALENKEDFNQTVSCAICNSVLGWSKEMFLEVLCKECQD